MKRKSITLIIVGVIMLSLIVCAIIFLPKFGYSSPENLMWLNPKTLCYKIYGTIESNERTLVVYKSNSSNRTEIIYEKDNRFYLFDYKTKPIVWEHTDSGMVIVRNVDGKYTIEISGVTGKQSINEVSDCLGTKFEYQNIEHGDSYTQQWFVALDEIPDDYYICIDNETIYVKK